jgi:hypothetical protein
LGEPSTPLGGTRLWDGAFAADSGEAEGAYVKWATGTAHRERTLSRSDSAKSVSTDSRVSLGLTSGGIAEMWMRCDNTCDGLVTGLAAGSFLPLSEAFLLLAHEDLEGAPKTLLIFDLDMAGGMKEALRAVTKRPVLTGAEKLSEDETVLVLKGTVVLKAATIAAVDLIPPNVAHGVFFDPDIGELDISVYLLQLGVDPATQKAAVFLSAGYLLGAVLKLRESAEILSRPSPRLVCLSTHHHDLRIAPPREFLDGPALPPLSAPVELTEANWSAAEARYEKYLDAMALTLKLFLLEKGAMRAKLLGYVDWAHWQSKFQRPAGADTDALAAAVATATENVRECNAGAALHWKEFSLLKAFDDVDAQVEAMKKGLRRVHEFVARL